MATQNQDRLKTHFEELGDSSHAGGWDALWKEGTFIPWDRGYANPALIDLLNTPNGPPTSNDANPTPGAPRVGSFQAVQLPPPVEEDGKRARVLIPGCGRGWDVVLFAAHGYDAVGLEISEHAALAAKEYLKSPGNGPLESEYVVRGNETGKGSTDVVQGDYFDNAWLGGIDPEGAFDIIYDNTFLCALPHSLRPRWAARTAQLLARNGLLICLEFPTHKPAKSGGPPWSLPPTVHAELLKRPGDEIAYDDDGVVVESDRPESDKALVRISHYVPKRTHTVGVVKDIVRDCVSVWTHK